MVAASTSSAAYETTFSLPGLSLTSRKVRLVAASTSRKRELLISLLRFPYIVQAEEKGLIQSDELCRNADVLRPGHSSTHLQEHCLTQGGT